MAMYQLQMLLQCSKNIFADRANIDMFDVRYQLRLNEIFDL